jgi:hypothetical protein
VLARVGWCERACKLPLTLMVHATRAALSVMSSVESSSRGLFRGHLSTAVLTSQLEAVSIVAESLSPSTRACTSPSAVPALRLDSAHQISSFAIEGGDSLAASSASSPLQSARLSQSYSDGETPGRLPSGSLLEPVLEESKPSTATAHLSDAAIHLGKACVETETGSRQEQGNTTEEEQTDNSRYQVVRQALSALIPAACVAGSTSTMAKCELANPRSHSGTENGDKDEGAIASPLLELASCPLATSPMREIELSSEAGGRLDAEVGTVAHHCQSSDLDSKSVESLGSYITGERSPSSRSPWLPSMQASQLRSSGHNEPSQPGGLVSPFTFPHNQELEGAHSMDLPL